MNWGICIIVIYLSVVANAQLFGTSFTGRFQPTFLASLIKYLQEGESQFRQEPRDRSDLLPEYDFVIVGAGTAGCVLANRLSENPNWKILLIEAGRTENYLMDLPILAQYWQLIETDWQYKTQPSKKACLGHKNKRCNWPRGKVMGGSSVLNYMIYTRGNRRDYDNWAKMGNSGWSYDDVLPYFKKIENFNVPDQFDPKYHSKDGYLSVEYPPWHTPLAEAFVEAAQIKGYPYVDYNGATQVGVSYLQTSMQNGTRHSSSRAYLHPASTRPNLHVTKYSMVTNLIIDDKNRVHGVQFRKFGQLRKVNAKREVILSAGAINSPHLLMLSGIGPKEHLAQFNIPVKSDLKVGYNLQDHWALGGLTFTVNQTISLRTERIISTPSLILDYFAYHTGPLSVPGGCEALMFLDVNNPKDLDGHPNLEILYIGGSIVSDPVFKRDFGITNKIYNEVYKPIERLDTWMAFPMLMLPKSRGRIRLASADPMAKPLIYANYYSHPDDIEVIVEGTKRIIELSDTKPFQKYGSKLNTNPIVECKHHGFGTDDYWRCHARYITFTIYHHAGTCKMGPDSDPDAVVNPRLLVRGVSGLRVVDASIMPVIPAAHTNSPVYMIAEKAADMIKQDWGMKI